ncbi:peptidase G2 autoproteolytic cleavage domain-containing protein [Paenibacillus sp. GP183]|uniref:peptidase G2 autoproteolytic cleavage domain-containing protein n=1 Tax=Paenibacillus sp. GP183 TaxID=1882751 RepID=UPI00209AB37F|nr:peptidase G2 autoproteolytic cleavage domain-containing protein [Paenibacillus sp. GP183]
MAGAPHAHAEGNQTSATALDSHSEGQLTSATNTAAHAEGISSIASGVASHAEGFNTNASGTSSHAEGVLTTASGSVGSHAEGVDSTASGFASHAEGLSTTASGDSSHAEGEGSVASGLRSHAEGQSTTASGDASHAAGNNTVADSFVSYAGGDNTNTGGQTGAFIIGQNATAAFPFSFHLGNGLAIGPTLNAVILDNAGNVRFDGALIGPAGADYAEMFETLDGNSIEVGYLVTLEGGKIRKANADDDYILGVTSATPAMIAASADLRWHKLFITDDWGRIQYHNVVVPEKRDEKGNILSPEYTKTEPILNPEYDSSKEYISRLLRPEWVAVGLLGQLLVRDDGTCLVNGYCKSNDEGVASEATTGYRVMKRTGPNQIQILFK